MARPLIRYVCQSCGEHFPKWAGQCSACGAWNSLLEEKPVALGPGAVGRRQGKGRPIPLTGLDSPAQAPRRLATQIGELDRALGDGLVPGSAVLIGGDPGIGKSTLLLDAAGRLARAGAKVVYISGEEAVAQIRLRAQRLNLTNAPVALAAATDLDDILATLDAGPAADVVVIDSIQTMYSGALEAAPGSVSQVRACAQALIRFAKERDTAMLMVGHVTKDGQIAGPRVLEHMVDCVLYFEGERGHQFRILRAVKNRFGGTDEIGVFEMTSQGLAEVANPSQLFLSNRDEPVTGSAVFAGIEGSRPILSEIQALVTPTPAANPRRTVVGWDSGRLAMVLAVLDARAGLGLGGCDVYLNVAGGLKIVDPAADLAVAAALVSSLHGRPVKAETVLFGEIALSGEVRPVAQASARLKEAAKLGFAEAWLPKGERDKGGDGGGGITRVELGDVASLVDLLAPDA